MIIGSVPHVRLPERRGEPGVWQQVFSETRRFPQTGSFAAGEDKQVAEGSHFGLQRRGLGGAWASPASSERRRVPGDEAFLSPARSSAGS